MHCWTWQGTAKREFPEAHFDLVRIGLTLYGTSPAGHMPPGLGLSPALALRARSAVIAAP